MATVTATELSLDSSLEQFKEQFNKLRTDVSSVTLASLGFSDGVVFEGATVDDFETTLVAADPTADRTITLPDASGTVLTSDSTATVSNKTISGASNTLSNIGNSSLTNSSITFGASGGTSTAASLGGTVTFAGTTNEVEVSESSGTITIGLPNDVTITGNLTVNGSTVTNSATNTTIEDVLIELGTGTSSASSDAGIVIERGSTGDNVFLGWDESADQVIFGTTTATGTSSGDLTITPGSTRVSGLIVNDSGTIGPATTTNALTFASNGNATFTGTIAATATATLLIKNSGGTTLKTINGIG
jgi:hypothetical protein